MTLTRLTPGQIVKQAEELAEELKRQVLSTPERTEPPADYTAWKNGGPLPESTEGLDWLLIAMQLEESI